jgi:hypothetical protein
MLRNSVVLLFIRLRVKARENPFRFEMPHRTPWNPTTVNRVRQPGAKMKIPIQSGYKQHPTHFAVIHFFKFSILSTKFNNVLIPFHERELRL